ncbi:phasin, PhaP [Marivita sp.]|uniref:phasin, PhaP n=1 Tax=Marivita sp. TaxID=2003365 RepID=UPI002603B84D|nr:phasin, PhaP [Marivita sp.]
MNKSTDMTATLKELMDAFPVDTKSMEEAYKNSLALTEKLSHVAIEAADKSADISTKWTKDMLAKLAEMSKAKAEPADYAQSMSDFLSAQAEVATENMAAFAELAKKIQLQTFDLIMGASKDFSGEAATAVKKPAADLESAAKTTSAAV